MSSFSWTPFTVERLLILRAQGLMHSSIAAELGTTLSAIEHKLRRLRSQKPTQPTAVRASSGQAFQSSSPSLSLDCVWERREALFCGKPKVGTSPYCFEHTQQAWQKPKSRDPNNPDRDPPACCPAKIRTALIW